MDDPTGFGGQARKTFRDSWIAVPAGIVVAVIGLLIGTLLLNGTPASQQGEPSASSPESESEPASEETSTSSPAQPSPEPSIFAPEPLTFENLTNRGRCAVPGWTGYDWDAEVSSIAGVAYTSGMSCRLVYRETSGYLDYIVPDGATRFTAVAGQPDDAPNTTLVVRFQVIDTTSGEVLATEDLRFGQSANFDVLLSDVIRITLKIDVLSYETVPRDLAGKAAWGEPVFV